MNLNLSSLTYIKGGPIEAADVKGKKLLVLEFWATWCPPCRDTIPHVTQVQKQFKDNVLVVGVTSEPSVGKIQQFVTSMGDQMDYTVAIDATGEVSSELMGRYQVRGIPHAFVLDKDFNVSWHGHPADPQFEVAIQKEVNRLPKPGKDPRKLSKEEIATSSVKDLKLMLQTLNVDHSDCIEKSDLVARVLESLSK